MKENKEKYSHISHFHCWNQTQPSACGISLEKHNQCCLCDLETTPKSEEIENIKEGMRIGFTNYWEKEAKNTSQYHLTIDTRTIIWEFLEQSVSQAFQSGKLAGMKENHFSVDSQFADFLRGDGSKFSNEVREALIKQGRNSAIEEVLKFMPEKELTELELKQVFGLISPNSFIKIGRNQVIAEIITLLEKMNNK